MLAAGRASDLLGWLFWVRFAPPSLGDVAAPWAVHRFFLPTTNFLAENSIAECGCVDIDGKQMLYCNLVDPEIVSLHRRSRRICWRQ